MKKIRLLAPVLAGLFLTSTAFTSTASAASLDDIQFWVGSGANRAALVIDWNDGKSAESLLWGYRWDGTATGLDMLHAVVDADPALFGNVSPAGPYGVSVYGLGYDLNGSGGFGVAPSLTFDAGGWSVGTPDDSRQPADAADHWQEGWDYGFWGYDIRNSELAPWGFASSGPSDRILTDGTWDGYSFAPGFNFTDPSEPAIAPVPEPTVPGLFVAAGLVLLGWWSRKSRPTLAVPVRIR
jgi:hypothetical protein